MEIKSIEKIAKYLDKLKEIDLKIITLEKLSKHHKGGCSIKIDFGDEKEEKVSSDSVFGGFTFMLRSSESSCDEDEVKEKETINLKYKERLIDTESLFLLDCLLKVKKGQRLWLISELNKLKVEI